MNVSTGPGPLTVYVVQSHRDYEGSHLTAIHTDEREARKDAFTRAQRCCDRYTVTPWSGVGPLDEGDEWEAPKAPRQPSLPREYVEAQKRYGKDLEEFKQNSQEFL